LVSGAFFSTLHICEVVVRNAISHALELKYGANWPWDTGFERSLNKWAKSELHFAKHGIPIGSTGKVIAELKFAFWCRLFTAGQDQHIWNAHLHTSSHSCLSPCRSPLAERCGTTTWKPCAVSVIALLTMNRFLPAQWSSTMPGSSD
jgi:hypothetical protein